MNDAIDGWIILIERIGVSGAILTLMGLFVWKYAAPLFKKQGDLVDKLDQTLDRQQATQEKQTEILEKIIDEEREEKRILRDIKDGVDELKRR